MESKKNDLISELIEAKFEGGRVGDVACSVKEPVCQVCLGCENHCALCDCCTCGCTGCECG